ncbi:MAG: hypothetical protein WBO35_00325 [Candidatus Saccharimonadales bacterium]
MQKYLDNGWPIVPIAKLAVELGIKKVAIDSQGVESMEHFIGRHPNHKDLQIITDAALDACDLPAVTTHSSELGTGTLMSYASANKLGQMGLDAIREAGYVVRVPRINLGLGHVGKVSVFPNPDEAFIAQLAEYTGVVIFDERSANSSPYQPSVAIPLRENPSTPQAA